jgi:hypothetical protein
MKFVQDSLNKQLKSSRRNVESSSAVVQRKRKSDSKKMLAKTTRNSSAAADDQEPCIMCKYKYGDEKDPNLKDDWDRCVKCKRWGHETCAALSGSYKKTAFTCDDCSMKTLKKKSA